MIQWVPPDPKDPRFEHIDLVKVSGNRIEFFFDPEWRPDPPKPGQPIPPEDHR